MRNWLVCSTVIICGCTIHVDPGTSDITKFPPSVAQQAEHVAVIQTGGRAIAKVQAISCQKALYEPLATNEAALLLLKAKAASVGADAVSDIEYRHHNIYISENCRDTVIATGTAVKQ